VISWRDRRARRPILVAAGVALLVAILGGLATDVGPWYRALQKPAWTPPDWLFGPAWTLIYALAALSAVEAWRAAAGSPARRRAIIGLFVANGALNVLWSVLFFAQRRPDWALFGVALLWLSIFSIIVMLGQRPPRRPAALMVPYLAWVTFAALLNLAVVRMNPPFGA
jgi:translocator protein